MVPMLVLVEVALVSEEGASIAMEVPILVVPVVLQCTKKMETPSLTNMERLHNMSHNSKLPK